MVCGTYSQGDTGLNGPFESGRRRGNVDGIDVLEFDLSYQNAMSFWRRIGAFARFALDSIAVALKEPSDVIFASSTPLTVGIPGFIAKWLKRKSFVFEVRDLWPELPRAMGVIRNPLALNAISALEWVCYHSADRLVALSPGIADGITKRRIPSDRITIIPNGCDLHIFSSSAVPWRPLGVNKDDLLAVFSGTHGVANGLDSVLDAARELKRRKENRIKLLLVGDGKMKPKLQARAEAEGLDNVLFHAPIPKIELAGLFSAADIGMQVLANVPAFYYGTSPNKFFDYIAAGLPVLNNYPGWVADLITEHQCGFVVAPDNARTFADALEEAAGNKAALKQMGQRALALAEKEFNRNTLAKKWTNWVEEVKY
jgi:glycosyltransferase involved in cell wall biosynthesis